MASNSEHKAPQQEELDGQRSASSDCLPLPERGAALEKSFAETLEALLNAKGTPKYDHNPPHTKTFSDTLREHPYRQLMRIVPGFNAPWTVPSFTPSIQVFGYFLDSLTTQDDTVIPIPRSRFWCLLRPSTELLLSDGRTQHYTMVYKTNLANDTIDMLDFWPDDFFLLRGRNVRGVSAKIIQQPNGGKLVQITRAEFERVIVGAISVELPEFHYHLLKSVPSGRTNARFMLALGILSFGEAGRENPSLALPYLNRALEIALEKHNQALARRIAKRLKFALVFSSYWFCDGVASTEVDDAQLFERQRGESLLKMTFPELSFFDAADKECLLWIAQTAWRRNYAQDAEDLCNAALQHSSDSLDALFWRAKARNKLLNHVGTIADSTKVIELIQQRLQDRASQPSLDEAVEDHDAYKIVSFFNTAHDRRRVEFMFSEAYSLRGNARNAMQQYDLAEADGRAVIASDPTRFDGYLIVAVSLHERKLDAHAVFYYGAARMRAGDLELRTWLDTKVHELASKAQSVFPEMQFGLVRSPGSPYVFIYKDARALADFIGTVGRGAEELERTVLAAVPQDSAAFTTGEDEAGNFKIEIDIGLAGGRWSSCTPEDDRLGWICRGVVPKFMFFPWDLEELFPLRVKDSS